VSFDEWCQEAEEAVGNHQLAILTSIAEQLTIGRDSAALIVPAHYASEERLADLLEKMGKPAAANFIRNKLPKSKKIRSGDLGEIFASEYVGESTAYAMPIRRLRWKDHREMSMRGDDLIAVRIPEDGSPIEFMKGETKSRAALSATVLNEARAALDNDNGLPSPHALSFVADRLHEAGDNEIADAIDKAQLEDGVQPNQVSHLLFVFCGGNPQNLMRTNLAAYAGTMNQLYVGLRVSTHQAFIKDVYAKVIENGNDD
jgi:Cap4 SAVED domain